MAWSSSEKSAIHPCVPSDVSTYHHLRPCATMAEPGRSHFVSGPAMMVSSVPRLSRVIGRQFWSRKYTFPVPVGLATSTTPPGPMSGLMSLQLPVASATHPSPCGLDTGHHFRRSSPRWGYPSTANSVPACNVALSWRDLLGPSLKLKPSWPGYMTSKSISSDE
jgi:hypothetical protein